MTPGRWLAPIGASAAVLAVFVVPGVIVTAGSGSGPGPDHPPDGVITPDDPVTPSLLADGVGRDRREVREVDVTGYRGQGRRLLVLYTVDQTTDCSSRIEEPEVEERADSVVVRLRRRPSQAPDQVCVNLLLTNSVEIGLSRPLGDRVLLDGSRGGALVPVEPPPHRTADVLPTPPIGRVGR
jgi:hypothetical protein